MAKLNVNEAIVVEIGPLIDDSDFKSLETGINWDAAGMSVYLIKNSQMHRADKISLHFF